jgi:hypothetical protein
MANNSEKGQGSQRAVVPVIMMMMMMMMKRAETDFTAPCPRKWQNSQSVL